MGIYDYMNHFWFVNENDPCSLSETSLYFYLLYEANRQHWLMPFKVSTQMLVARLNTSKQNVMKARDGLRKRGLIGFSKGEGKGKPALYTLCLTSTDGEMSQTLPLSQTLTLELTKSLPPKLWRTRFFPWQPDRRGRGLTENLVNTKQEEWQVYHSLEFCSQKFYL